MKISTRHPRLERLRYLDCNKVELTVEFDPGLGTRTLYIRSDGGQHVLEMNLYNGDIIESKQIPTAVVDAVHDWASLVEAIPEVYLDDSKLEFGRGDDHNLVSVKAEREGESCTIRATVNDGSRAIIYLDLLSGTITKSVSNSAAGSIMPDLFQAVCIANWAWGEWI